MILNHHSAGFQMVYYKAKFSILQILSRCNLLKRSAILILANDQTCADCADLYLTFLILQ